jgi:hypothetical protein
VSEDRNYFDELKINKNSLDREWDEQAEKSMYWGKQAAIAQKEFDKIEMRRKIKKAELYKKHRKILMRTELRVTDVMIEAEVRTDPEYEQITDEWINAKERASIMNSAQWEFISRKFSMEKIQEGIIKGLFADPRSAGQIEKEETKDDRLRDHISEHSRRKRA